MRPEAMDAMKVETQYRHLERRPDKRSREFFIKGRGIRASTIWHDRYVGRLSPAQIAKDRGLRLEAVHEALDFCEESWESICEETERDAEALKKRGFFRRPKIATA